MEKEYFGGLWDADGTFYIREYQIVKSSKYMAGLWDGDGSFGISKKFNYLYPNKEKSYLRYQPFAAITLCSPKAEIIYKSLEEEFGFKCIVKGKRYNTKYRLQYKWALSSKKACEFAEKMHPYLVIKKEQAEIMMQWPKSNGNYSENQRSQIRKIQDELYQRMKVLNKRGT